MIKKINCPQLSNERLHYLAKLKQKKYRLQEELVIVEGKKTLTQLSAWGIKPRELYLVEGEPTFSPEISYTVSEQGMKRLCASEQPQKIAGLFSLPKPRKIAFQKAFYLDKISDPGNLGTIFRIAAAFNVDCLVLSPESCEVSSPKVIRASLGAVYQVPFFFYKAENLQELKTSVFALEMQGEIPLAIFIPPSEPFIVALGNETKGLSEDILQLAKKIISIPMPGKMESLNVSAAAAILAYSLSQN